MNQKKSRRTFIEFGLKSGLALPFLATGLMGCESETKGDKETTSTQKLKILILGGTSFLGPHQIAYALQRGHTVTTFTRGKTKPSIYPDLFEKVEQLIGDRQDNLTALENRKWDVVIDNSGHKVEWAEKSAKLLKDQCELYLYTSSTGVYYPYTGEDYKEDAKVLLERPADAKEIEKMEYDYGVMKANSELAVQKYFGEDRTLVVRPTYMIGPADKTNRFIYWPLSLSQGKETIVPGKDTDPVQYLDVRDAAEFMIRLLEDKKTGTYNAVGPESAQDIKGFTELAQKTFDVENTFVRIDDYDFLEAQEVYYIVPWIPPTGNNAGSSKANNQKARNNGLTFRSLTDSIIDTLDWWNSDLVGQKARDEYLADKTTVLARTPEIIKEWKSRKKG